MVTFDLEFFIAVLLFVFSLMLAVKPVKRVGIINFIVGFFTIVIASTIALGFTGDTSLVEQYFMICIDVVGVFCMLRADGVVS